MTKKIKALLLSLLLILAVGCSKTETAKEEEKPLKITLVLDEGGVNDQSFNQSAWEGALKLREECGVDISYIESKQESEYLQNVETAIDQENDLVIAVGYKFTEAVKQLSEAYPSQKFALIDGTWEEMPSNVVSIMFSEEDAGYSVGLVASQMTSTNKVGFIGGFDIPSVSNFYKGFEKAIKEENADIEVLCQYANSFTDSAKGRAIAQQMINQDIDIIFTAGGGVNNGAWEACTESNIKAIGVDMPSSHIAPTTIITSALKNVGTGLELTAKDLINGKFAGGEVKMFDLSNKGVGYEVTDLIPTDVVKYVEDKLNN